MHARDAVLPLVFLAALSGVCGSEALPRSAPEAQGVSSRALHEFVAALDAMDTMNSLMVVRNGHVIAEGWWAPYNPESPHELYSLSKSFTSTAVGFAVAEGKLSVDDPVLKFFPEDAPSEPGGNLRAMRVRDLLCMSTGHQDEPSIAPGTMSAKAFLAHPVPHKPGTHFRYNTPATFMQSAIVQKVTGQTVLDYLKPRLFEPLGIEGATWGTNFEGVTLGGYGLKVRTEDIAKFGQLYLQKCKWKGRQLIPAEWIEAATARQTSNGSNPASDWDQGYGYQFWRCRHGAYRGDGAFGQYCVVLPDKATVIAITSGVRDMQAVLNVIWDKLLPALQPGSLPVREQDHASLQSKLKSLSVRFPEGAANSRKAAQVKGHKYVFPPNDQKLEAIVVTAEEETDGVNLKLLVNGVETRIPCGNREWRKARGYFGSGLMGPYADEPLAASAAWESDNVLLVKVCAYETPFYSLLRLEFGEEGTLRYTREVNAAFGPTRQPPLTGRRQD